MEESMTACMHACLRVLAGLLVWACMNLCVACLLAGRQNKQIRRTLTQQQQSEFERF